MSKIIAIDLGTSNSVVCANIGGVRTVIPNDLGSNTTPSAVAFKKDGEKLVGQVAKRQQITNFKNTFSSFKRLMGHTFEEIKDEKTFSLSFIFCNTSHSIIFTEKSGRIQTTY